MTRALMFIACGILFNHECLSATTPLIVRQALRSALADRAPQM